MHRNAPTYAEVEGWLVALGVESLCQWDLLVFLYRHQSALVGMEGLAQLLGYGIEPVTAALDMFESLELVEPSRVSQETRLYQFRVPSLPARGAALERLLGLAGDRAGRLLLFQLLPPGNPSPPQQREAGRRSSKKAVPVVRAAPQRPRKGKIRRQTWRKAI